MKPPGYQIDGEEEEGFEMGRRKGRKPSPGGSQTKGAGSFFRVVQRACGSPNWGPNGWQSGGKTPHRNQKGKGRFTSGARQNMQRVVVKARVVRHPAGGKSLRVFKLHLSYLTRPGVELEGPDRSRCYDEKGPLEKRELDLWAREIAGDRHHFRFIVSPEKARELELSGYARELVQAMEKDLGTRLEFLAVNHYNTDNPHVHLIVRGRNDRGRDLVMGRDYLACGVRNRAREIATSFLGHRTELEIRDGLLAEITLERFTGIDRELLQLQEKSPEKRLDLRLPEGHENSIAAFHRIVRKQRLRELERLGLARETSPGLWQLSEETERVLRELGIQRDIIKTMHKSLAREADRELVIFDPNDPMQRELRGKVLDRGIANELKDEKYLVIDAADRKAYYVGLSRFSEAPGLEALPGSEVSISVRPHELEPRIADGNILEISRDNGGIYDEELHLARTGRLPPGVTREEYLENHLKRLRVLERNGLAQKLDRGLWRVPDDLVERMRGLALERGLRHEVEVRLEAPARVLERAPALERQLTPEREPTR